MIGILASQSLADHRVLRACQERFSKQDPGVPLQMIFFAALMIAAVLVVWWLDRLQRRRAQPARQQPALLYRRVLRAIGLPWTDRWWLRQLAKVLRIEHPTALLISPALYDAAVRKFCKTKGLAGPRTYAAATFTNIRSRLFTKA